MPDQILSENPPPSAAIPKQTADLTTPIKLTKTEIFILASLFLFVGLLICSLAVIGAFYFKDIDKAVTKLKETTSTTQTYDFNKAAVEVKLTWGKGDYDGSLKKAKVLLTKASTNKEKAIAHYWIGLSYYKQNKLDLCEKEELLAVELDPQYGAPYVTLSAVVFTRNDCNKALEYAKKAVELAPDYAWAHNNLGLSYLCLGEREKGLEELRTAVKLAPDSYVFQDNLNRALQQK